jgi:hypothetical protein
MEETPEGYLLCKNVPIARTGVLDYAQGETDNINVDPKTGIAKVICSPEELFKPETIASFNGKPVVDEHPRNFDDWTLNPVNTAKLQRGTVLNARQGEGEFADCLMADLLITDKELIKDIRAGKREVSCGYQSKGVQTAPGQGKKTAIVGNHVALVKSGRCGQRCSIKDHSMERNMSKRKSWKDRVSELLGMSKDADEFKQAVENEPLEKEPSEKEEEEGGTHVHIHSEGASKYNDSDIDELKKKLEEHEGKINDCAMRLNTHDEALEKKQDKPVEKPEDEEEEEDLTDDAESKELEENLAEEAPEGKEEEAKKSEDSAYLVNAFKAARSGAEILAPGIKIPTFDSKSDPKTGFTSVCLLRRKALSASTRDEAMVKLLTPINGGKAMTNDSISKMGCSEVRTKFNAAVALKKQQNSAVTLDGRTSLAGGTAGKIKSIADLNKANADFYKNQ